MGKLIKSRVRGFQSQQKITEKSIQKSSQKMTRKNIEKNSNLEPKSLPKWGPQSKKCNQKKWLENMANKGGTGTFDQGESQPCHTKGGDCLGISPPSQKGKESKEAHEESLLGKIQGKIEDNLKNYIKNLPKSRPNSLKIHFWRPLGALLGSLGRLLGSRSEKIRKKTDILKPTWHPKSTKDPKKTMLKKHLFWDTFFPSIFFDFASILDPQNHHFWTKFGYKAKNDDFVKYSIFSWENW